MPELPEVEALAEFLAGELAGRTVESVRVYAISALQTYDPPVEALVGQQIDAVTQQGKYLVLRVGDMFAVVHFSKSGWAKLVSGPVKPTKARPGRGPMAVVLGFDDGRQLQLTEAATEKRLRLWIVRSLAEIADMAELGVDVGRGAAAESDLRTVLRTTKGRVRSLLTDQSIVAGVGNAYADEILHLAKVSPFATSQGLSDTQLDSLVAAVTTVLDDARGRSRGLSATELKKEKKSGFRVHARTGQPCPECGDTIREIAFVSRSWQYCPTCQTDGKILADRRLSRLLK